MPTKPNARIRIRLVSGMLAALLIRPVGSAEAFPNLRPPSAQSPPVSVPQSPTDRQADLLAGRKLVEAGEEFRARGTKEDSLRAIERYEEALRLFRKIDEPREEAVALRKLGMVHASLGETAKARARFESELEIRRRLGDRPGEAESLNGLAMMLTRLGDPPKALDLLERSLALHRELGDRFGEAGTLYNMATILSNLGDHRKALELLSTALGKAREIENPSLQARILMSLGVSNTSLGEKRTAMETYERAVSLFQQLGARHEEAVASTNLGLLYSDVQEYRKAVPMLKRSLSVFRASGNRRSEGFALRGLGNVYSALGDRQTALSWYEQAVSCAEAAGEKGLSASLRNLIGLETGLAGNVPKALELHDQALEGMQAVGDREGQMRVLFNLGRLRLQSDESRAALDAFDQSLRLAREIGQPDGEAFALHGIGSVLLKTDVRKSLEHSEKAVELWRRIGNRSGVVSGLRQVALGWRALGNVEEALKAVREAVTLIETVRADAGSVGNRLSYFETVQGVHQLYIDLLMTKHKADSSGGWAERAFEAAEQSRARSLLDLLSEHPIDAGKVADATDVKREAELRQRINDKAEILFRLKTSGRGATVIESLEKEIQGLSLELDEARDRIRTAHPRYADLTQPRPLSMRELQDSVLDNDTTLLEYALGDERGYVWIVSKHSMRVHELPPRNEIDAAARRVHESLSARGRFIRFETSEKKRERIARADDEYRKATLALSEMILTPALRETKNGNRRLVIVPDGALGYVPFAALPVPRTAKSEPTFSPPGPRPSALFLIERGEIVVLPSASTLAALRREYSERPPSSKTVAVLADPVFEASDVRVTNPGNGVEASSPAIPTDNRATSDPVEAGTRNLTFLSSLPSARQTDERSDAVIVPRLPQTRREASEIGSLVSSADRFLALDFEASRDTLKRPEFGNHRIVHLATHGVVNTERPELSGLVLSMVDETGAPRNGLFLMNDVYGLELKSDLVVLSACGTGLGKEIKGEGLMSLTRGFMYAGTPRVVVSLWNIEDKSAAELMTRFYKGLLKRKLSPSAALRAAQTEMLRHPQLSQPYYWAGFVLQGEYR